MCLTRCVCAFQMCVSALVLRCHLKRRRKGDAFKPRGEQWYKKRASEMFASHLDSCENASSFSCHVKWRQIKGPVLFIFSLKVMPRSAVLQIHFYVFSSNQTSFCPEPICFYRFQFSGRLKKRKKLHPFESTGSFLQLFGDGV